MAQLIVGQSAPIQGNVTTLNWINARSPSDVERSLGYGAGRLAAGYWVLLLKQMLTPADFEFDGTTLRSGGRAGLPAPTQAQDNLRPRVHDQIRAQRPANGGHDPYVEMQQAVLRSVRITGPQRIAKVIPVTPHDPLQAPDVQYPPGGGGLQWKLIKPCSFLVALKVDSSGMATTPRFSLSIAAGAPYDNRHRVNQLLTTA